MREVLVALPDPIPPSTAVRGTVLVSSQQAIRERGREEAYWRALSPADAQQLRQIVAASWVPIDLGIAHYRAVDSLGFSEQEAVDMGIAVSVRTNRSFIGTLARSLRAAGGVSPLIVLSRIDRVVGRMMQGGAAAAYLLGPKEGRVEMHRNPLTRIPYCRAAWAGLIEGGLGLVSKRVFVRPERDPPGEDTLAYAVSWV